MILISNINEKDRKYQRGSKLNYFLPIVSSQIVPKLWKKQQVLDGI